MRAASSLQNPELSIRVRRAWSRGCGGPGKVSGVAHGSNVERKVKTLLSGGKGPARTFSVLPRARLPQMCSSWGGELGVSCPVWAGSNSTTGSNQRGARAPQDPLLGAASEREQRGWPGTSEACGRERSRFSSQRCDCILAT